MTRDEEEKAPNLLTMTAAEREQIYAEARAIIGSLPPGKERTDRLEALWDRLGSKKVPYTGSAMLVIAGPLEPNFQPGDTVQVRIEDGSWRGGLRAISSAQDGTAEFDGQKVVWVTWEEEWQAAQREGRKPGGQPWPYEWVEFWEDEEDTL